MMTGMCLRLRVLLERLADLGPGDVRQHEVEQDQVGAVLAGQAQAVLAAERRQDLVARLPQVVVEDLLQVLLVLDDQDARHCPLL